MFAILLSMFVYYAIQPMKPMWHYRLSIKCYIIWRIYCAITSDNVLRFYA